MSSGVWGLHCFGCSHVLLTLHLRLLHFGVWGTHTVCACFSASRGGGGGSMGIGKTQSIKWSVCTYVQCYSTPTPLHCNHILSELLYVWIFLMFSCESPADYEATFPHGTVRPFHILPRWICSSLVSHPLRTEGVVHVPANTYVLRQCTKWLMEGMMQNPKQVPALPCYKLSTVEHLAQRLFSGYQGEGRGTGINHSCFSSSLLVSQLGLVEQVCGSSSWRLLQRKPKLLCKMYWNQNDIYFSNAVSVCWLNPVRFSGETMQSMAWVAMCGVHVHTYIDSACEPREEHVFLSLMKVVEVYRNVWDFCESF